MGARAPARSGTGAPGLSGANPFAPTTLRIEPITRIEPENGGARIELHIELTDRFGDDVKAIGILRAQLLRVGADLDPAGAARVANWEIDLSDPEVNASYYDPVTRTYRASLTGAPAWAAQPGSGGRPLIRASFLPSGPGAPEGIVLSDEYAPPR